MQASKVDGLDELQKQSGVIDTHQTKLEELANPEKGKKKAAELARKAAVDHFAGKEEQLKAGNSAALGITKHLTSTGLIRESASGMS